VTAVKGILCLNVVRRKEIFAKKNKAIILNAAKEEFVIYGFQGAFDRRHST
jgi:hypothetical protein